MTAEHLNVRRCGSTDGESGHDPMTRGGCGRLRHCPGQVGVTIGDGDSASAWLCANCIGRRMDHWSSLAD
jgi:hypothetical protein